MYHSLCTSGFIKLSSEQTLPGYTHFTQSKPGFSSEFLANESWVEDLPKWKRHVVLFLNQKKKKEGLVFDRNETEIVGFGDMGDVSTGLTDIEKQCSTNQQHPTIGTHMLVLL